MKHYIQVIVCSLLLSQSILHAQVPMLNSSTVTMPKSQTLNKCIGKDNKITYTQFECEATATKADDEWIENANLTFVLPEKYIIFDDKNSLPGQLQGKSIEEMIEGKNFMELFNMGIQSYIQRAALLNSL